MNGGTVLKASEVSGVGGVERPVSFKPKPDPAAKPMQPNHRPRGRKVLLAAGGLALAAAAATGTIGWTHARQFGTSRDASSRGLVTREAPTPVRTVPVALAGETSLRLPGVLRSQKETPLAFRLTGQVVSRDIAAGTRVVAGAMLFRLDDRELRRSFAAAQANRVAAGAQAENAVREAGRREELTRHGVSAVETTERSTTEAQAAVQRLRAAEADEQRAALALAHATLTAPAAGVVTEILAEAGQVVTAGQQVASLAHAGPREAEVYIPESRLAGLPTAALVTLHGEQKPRMAQLREVAAAADPATRAYRARYVIDGLASDTPVGSSLALTLTADAGAFLRVPTSAVAETGSAEPVNDFETCFWLV